MQIEIHSEMLFHTYISKHLKLWHQELWECGAKRSTHILLHCHCKLESPHQKTDIILQSWHTCPNIQDQQWVLNSHYEDVIHMHQHAICIDYTISRKFKTMKRYICLGSMQQYVEMACANLRGTGECCSSGRFFVCLFVCFFPLLASLLTIYQYTTRYKA